MKNAKIFSFFAFLIFLFCPTTSLAQENGAEKIKADVNFVPMDIVVLDKRGHAISGLKKENFRIGVRRKKHHGKEWQIQEIKPFEEYNLKRRIRILIDVSDSMEYSNAFSKEIAAEMVRVLQNGDDEFSVWQFNEKTTEICAWTKDIEKIKAAIKGIRTGGRTDIYGSLFLDVLSRQNSANLVDEMKDITILITDGDNNFPEPLVTKETGEPCDQGAKDENLCRSSNKEDLIAYFNSKRALLYVADFSNLYSGSGTLNYRVEETQKEWREIAGSTGGMRLPVHGDGEAREVARKISEMTGTRYLMGFYLHKETLKAGVEYEIRVEIGETKDGKFEPGKQKNIELVYRNHYQVK